jgi:hypothetical protein
MSKFATFGAVAAAMRDPGRFRYYSTGALGPRRIEAD